MEYINTTYKSCVCSPSPSPQPQPTAHSPSPQPQPTARALPPPPFWPGSRSNPSFTRQFWCNPYLTRALAGHFPEILTLLGLCMYLSFIFGPNRWLTQHRWRNPYLTRALIGHFPEILTLLGLCMCSTRQLWWNLSFTRSLAHMNKPTPKIPYKTCVCSPNPSQHTQPHPTLDR